MSQLVGKSLENVWLPARSIINNVVVGGSDCPLPDVLTHQEKIIPEKMKLTGNQAYTATYKSIHTHTTYIPPLASDGVIHDSARGWVRETLGPTTAKDTGGNPLLHYNDGHLGFVVIPKGRKTRCHLRNLVLHHNVHLPIAHPITKHHNTSRKTAIDLVVIL